MNASPVAAGADKLARWSAVALGLTIPVSPALDGILMGLALLALAMSGEWRAKLAPLRANPVALAAVALFAVLALGTLYGDQGPGEARHYLVKYVDLLFVPVFAVLFRDAATRRQGVYALAASLGAVLLLSYLLKAGAIPAGTFRGDAATPVVFKYHLTQNILLAYGAFLFAELARTAQPALRRLWIALVVLCIVNVLFIGPGRTGHLILFLLMLYWGYAWRRWRGLGAAAAVVAALISFLTLTPSAFRERFEIAGVEALQWEASQESAAARAGGSRAAEPAGAETTSVGLRLDFYRNTLAIVRDHPLIGVGTGGFPKAYAERARDGAALEVRNPHNEYLMIAAQTGVVGLALLLHLFWRQWRLAPRLATPMESHLARALLLAIAAGSLFNSLLLDHTEGLLYAWMTGLLYAGLQSRGDSVIK